MPIFNLSKTSNYGIRLAGQGIICKTDPDCVFSDEAMQAVAGVTETKGVSLRYYMANSYESRHQSDWTWDASKGTLALHWSHWDAICGYRETCEGYGIEDGDCYHRAGQLDGHSVERLKLPFWHIAHNEGAVQRRRRMRLDRWNMHDLNPRNHKENARAMADGPWRCETWGVPS